ncbi:MULTISPECIES: glycosyltransferase family 2 protein [unclassified Blastococcus]
MIPTRDRRRLVLRAIDSVLRQREVQAEVVVVDDGSQDGTADAVEGLAHPRVRLVRHERSRGVSGARNAGLAEVRTPWVAFLDDDDLWAPGKLRAQLAALRAVPGALWSCVGALHVDGDLRATEYAPAPASGRLLGELSRRPAVPGGGSGVLVRTTEARDVGGFDEELSILADWDFYVRLGAGSPVAAVDQPLLAYYVHSDSMYHDPDGVVRELTRLRHKHRDLAGGERFDPDLAHWYVRVARMAQLLGAPGTAVRLLGRGVAEAGIVPVSRQLARRLTGQLGSDARGVGAAPAPPPEWLAAYAGWAR